MTFRLEEKPTSGSSTAVPPSRQLEFYASGSADVNFVINSAIGATPAVIFTPQGVLYRQDVKLDWEASDYCNVTVPYGPNSAAVGGYKISFDTSGGTVHITSSRGTAHRYGLAGPGDAPDLGGTIGWNGDDVDGCEIVVPALRLNVSFRHPQGVITLARIKQLARNTSYVNDDDFLTFAAGEVLFLGASGEEGTDCETTINYQLACAENADGANKLTIGAIANIVKRGHDYAWVRYADDVDAGPPKRPIKFAKHVYVERVYAVTSFKTLFGFG